MIEAPSLQEQNHHQNDEPDGGKQRMNDGVDRSAHENVGS